MQWLYNLLHGIIVVLFGWFGKMWWLLKNAISFRLAVITTVLTTGTIFWRMFYNGVTTLISSASEIQTTLGTVSSVSSVGDILDLANFLFPVEEAFAMISILITYGMICLSIRIIRAFIPTMT